MLKALFVAEKNDVAKGVASFLSNGNFRRREGKSKFNKIYELNMQLMGKNALVSVTSVSGHLMEWAFHADMSNWQTVIKTKLFEAPLKHQVPPNMVDIAKTLTDEAKKNDVLVIWTDCDREGENIGAEIVKVCTSSNRRMDVYRAKFSEVSASAVWQATNRLVRLDRNIVDAVDCRSELDLRIGQKLISYGSCQFPTLGFVVDRYKLIKDFQSEVFWKLVMEHMREGVKVDFLWDRNRLFDRDVVNVLYDNCQEKTEAVVEKVVKKPKSRYRPYALETVELEKLGSSKLKMSAKEVMTIAEKLYNKGWISYPRTETNKFPDGMDLDSLVRMQTPSTDWGAFSDEILQRGSNPRNGRKSDEAHPPIHPLKFADRKTLAGNEWRVYELVVRHFLACLSRDATGEETIVNVRIGTECFHANGLRVKDLGYMNVYVYDKWGDKKVPGYEEGEVLKDYQLRIADGCTQPPELLTESELIALMDKYGIGTDATHAEHIEKIKERQYIGVKKDGKLLPSFVGLALVDGYDDMGFAMSKPDLRANLELGLREICEGRKRKEDVLSEQIGKYRSIFEDAERKVGYLSVSLQRYLDKRANDDADGQNGNNGRRPGNDGGGGGGGGAGGRPTQGKGRKPRKSPQIATAGAMEGQDDQPARRRRNATNTNKTTTTTANRDSTEETVMCTCAPPQKAVQKTVQKEGPNKGRKFWTCSLPFNTSEKCSFFKWV